MHRQRFNRYHRNNVAARTWFQNRGGTAATNAITQFSSDFNIPEDYRPNVATIANASGKAIVTDGTRVVRRSDGSGGTTFGQLNFSTFNRQNTGGSFAGDGPELSYYNNSPYYPDENGQLSEAAKTYAYRHNNAVNTVHLDGHAATLGEAESREFERWVPTGTTVVNPNNTDDPNDQRGDVAN